MVMDEIKIQTILDVLNRVTHDEEDLALWAGDLQRLCDSVAQPWPESTLMIAEIITARRELHSSARVLKAELDKLGR